MGSVLYLAKKGSLTVDKYTFTAGVRRDDVEQGTIDYLKSNPDYDGLFSFNGAPPEKTFIPAAKKALYGGRITDEEQQGPKIPVLPVKGFQDKASAIAFAKNVLELELSETTALKTLNTKIAEAYQDKFLKPKEGGDLTAEDMADAVKV